MKSLLALTLLLGLVDVDAGLAAYAAGDHGLARELLAQAVEEAGDDAPGELLYDHALAALRADELQEALEAADAAAAEADARGDALTRAHADLVRGSVAYLRCRRAAALVDRAEAEPFLLDQAILQAERALESFAEAVMSRDDWPVARRNAERAARALGVLRAERDARDEGQDEPRAPPPPPPPEPDGESEERAPEATAEPELSAAELQQLRVALQREEQEKRALRRARRAERSLDVERDW